MFIPSQHFAGNYYQIFHNYCILLNSKSCDRDTKLRRYSKKTYKHYYQYIGNWSFCWQVKKCDLQLVIDQLFLIFLIVPLLTLLLLQLQQLLWQYEHMHLLLAVRKPRLLLLHMAKLPHSCDNTGRFHWSTARRQIYSSYREANNMNSLDTDASYFRISSFVYQKSLIFHNSSHMTKRSNTNFFVPGSTHVINTLV